MRRLFILGAALTLLSGAAGCSSCCGGGDYLSHTAGACDCDDGPQYGCFHALHYGPGNNGHMHAEPAPEVIKELPRDTMPKEPR